MVGMLITHAAMNDPVFDYFRVGLREHGYEDGYNIKLEILTAEGQLDRLPGLAEQLVRDKVDVIVSPNELSARAALQATSTIPIVLAAFGYDPVALGLVDSFDRPGGNITGTYTLSSELAGKRLEILKSIPLRDRVWHVGQCLRTLPNRCGCNYFGGHGVDSNELIRILESDVNA